jgi:amino acid adenylation domain-containing protein
MDGAIDPNGQARGAGHAAGGNGTAGGLRWVPASFAQQRLWFLDQLVPGNPFYNEHAAMRIAFPVNAEALERSVAEIVRRHETLRTTFAAVDGEPVQVIAPTAIVSLPRIDLRHLPPDARPAEAARVAADEARRPFDLQRGPLLRTTLLQLDDGEYAFLLTTHHIISDGWSLGVFGRELETLYPAMAMGRSSPLAPLPIQYSDYSAWQREFLSGPRLDEQLAYWRRQLDGLPVLQLPTDHPRPAVPTFRGAVHTFEIAESLAARLRTVGQSERATLFMVLFAAFQVLLTRYTGQEDVVVGVPIANRTRTELESLIGFFVNTLVFRTDSSGNPTIRELLQRVRRTSLDAYAHQDLPFEKLVEELQPRRDLSRNPLCQVMFQLFAAGAGGTRPAEQPRSSRALAIERDTAKFDLTVHIFEEGGGGLSAKLEYSADLFDARTIARMARHYRQVLEAFANAPEERIWQVALLTPAEQRQILVEWNATGRDYPAGCFHELFEEQVGRAPDALAVDSERERLTYRQLNERANQLAAYLRTLRVGPDVVVAIALERSPLMVIAVLATMKAGGAYLPLDPEYPADRLGFMISDAAAPVLLTESALAPSIPSAGAQTVCLDAIEPELAQYSTTNVAAGAAASSLAYVIYTSGSTGMPKGVMIEHRGLCNATVEQTRVFRVGRHGRVLQFSSFSFDGWVYELMMAVGSGACLCFASDAALVPGPGLVQALRDLRITMVLLPPSALATLPPADLPLLECLHVAGEACPPQLVSRWAPGRRLADVYGPTEVTCWCTAAEYTGAVERVHIGRPMANAEIYILDSHHNPVPVGVVGELHIASAGLARGYLNRPELTSERFVPHPFSQNPDARLYVTGDLARYLPDGTIEFLGRRDHQVKLRGFRVELGEIETALAAVTGVREAAVVCLEDTPGDKRLAAYVVSDAEHAVAVAELRAALRERLPEYMVPSTFTFLEALPLNRSGKVDRAALPRPSGGRDQAVSAPATDLERSVAAVWREILGVDAVGVDDNFFDLGGHSLLIAKLHSRLSAILPREISLIDLFRYPTIGSLTKHVGTKEPTVDAFMSTIQQRIAKQRARPRPQRPLPHHESEAS